MRRVPNTATFPCPWEGCNKSYTRMHSLSSHLQKHRGVTSYACTWPECQRAFHRKDGLMAHMRSHTKEKTVVCPDCGTKLAGKNGLPAHRILHRDELMFKCTWEDCTASFAQKAGFLNHLATHQNAREYPCTWPGCDKTFNTERYLTKHSQRSHAMGKRLETYRCEAHGLRFLSKATFLWHINKHHGTTQPPELSE